MQCMGALNGLPCSNINVDAKNKKKSSITYVWRARLIDRIIQLGTLNYSVKPVGVITKGRGGRL